MRLICAPPILTFQSTRPARGATRKADREQSGVCISIHAPREGRDTMESAREVEADKFQSTRPSRGATILAALRCCVHTISIHAPLAGRDQLAAD